MKWTSEQIGIVQEMAASGLTTSEAAAKLCVSKNTIAGIAFRNQIKFGEQRRRTIEAISGRIGDLRERWLAEMPRLRANVRAAAQAEVDAMAAGAAP